MEKYKFQAKSDKDLLEKALNDNTTITNIGR